MQGDRIVLGALTMLACGLPALAGGECLFRENFESNPTGQWTINGGPSDESVDFYFDYSIVGIPAAPHGTGTHGMKMQANLVNGIFSGFSVSPIGQSFTGDYTVRFDLWANSNGPFPFGGSGSANLSTFGIGTAGAVAQWPGAGPAIDSVWFGVIGDGNSSSDYRAYSSAAPTSYPGGSPVYSASSNNCSDPYFAMFGNVGAPAAQLALFPQQTGNVQVGAAGMAWHDVEITKGGNFITWRIDGLLIATIDVTTVVLGGSNIFFGHSDVNSTSSTDPNDVHLLFTLIDNVRVGTTANSCTCHADIVSSDTFLPPGDGVVDGADLAYLLGAWGRCE